jgi:hypothetical protein
MQQYQDLKLNPVKNSSLHYMLRPIIGCVEIGRNCYDFRAIAIGVPVIFQHQSPRKFPVVRELVHA